MPNRAIVVAAGYNDGSVGAAVDAIVEEACRQGVPHVVWLTYRVAGSNAATYRSHNSVLWQKAQQYPELTIADWAGRSAGRSDSVAADGLHLNGSGAAAMATPIGPDGRICYVNGPTARVHVVVDHLVTIDATDITFVDATPRRLFDTRGSSPVAPGGRRCVAVAGAVGDLAVVDLTPVRAQGRGNGVLVGSGVSVTPSVSNVNYQVGSVDPNVGVAAIGGDGRVCCRNADRSAVHLVADHLMTIRASAVAHIGPGWVLDTRR